MEIKTTFETASAFDATLSLIVHLSAEELAKAELHVRELESFTSNNPARQEKFRAIGARKRNILRALQTVYTNMKAIEDYE